MITDLRRCDGMGAQRETACNSSHGGSCCACGGPLPRPHWHIEIEPLYAHALNGGNVCCLKCADRFDRFGECPGHKKHWWQRFEVRRRRDRWKKAASASSTR